MRDLDGSVLTEMVDVRSVHNVIPCIYRYYHNYRIYDLFNPI